MSLSPAPCQAPDPNPRSPSFAVPAGACDCHVHIFGPPSRPFALGRRYTPAAAGLEEFRLVQGRLRLSRAVIVQPDIYQDNGATLDALAATGGAWRGIAKLNEDTSDEEIAYLHEHGFRGVRLDARRPDGLTNMQALAERVAPYGWHIQLHALGHDLPRLAPVLEGLPLPFVLDHFGRIDAAAGLNQAGFATLLALLASGRCWVKLSAPYRCEGGAPPYAGLAAYGRALVDAAPDRMLWGSDWPHSSHDGFMPNDGDLLEQLLLWAPEERQRTAILRDNPGRLYDFPAIG
jgi:2-pyrone-4,6-dicarboxylate lactonase